MRPVGRTIQPNDMRQLVARIIEGLICNDEEVGILGRAGAEWSDGSKREEFWLGKQAGTASILKRKGQPTMGAGRDQLGKDKFVLRVDAST